MSAFAYNATQTPSWIYEAYFEGEGGENKRWEGVERDRKKRKEVRGGRGTVSVTPQIFTWTDVISRPNKKLRNRAEHSASIVFSWCTL